MYILKYVKSSSQKEWVNRNLYFKHKQNPSEKY
jgi:hypothetical protein